MKQSLGELEVWARPRRREWLVALAVSFLVLGVPAVGSQNVPGAAETTPAAVNAGLGQPPEDVNLSTPRQSIRGFLATCNEGRFDEATHYLNLSEVEQESQAKLGPRLARRIFLVVLRRAHIDPDTVPNDPGGVRQPGAPPLRERLATLTVRGREVPIALERLDTPTRGGVWLLSKDTVSRVNALYRDHGYGWVGDHLPSVFFSLRILGLQLWQWTALALALLLGYGVARAVGHMALVTLGAAARRTTVSWDDAAVKALDGPLALVLWGIALMGAIGWVGLPPTSLAVARIAWRVLTLFGVGWLLFRTWDAFTLHLRRSTDDSNQLAVAYLPIISRAGKFVVAVLIVLAGLDVIGVNVVAALAGLGLGGVAVAFAAQKTIENIFGAITIAGDRPFMIGDFVTAGGVTGTVEEIGLRSTRVRTLDRMLVTIPNGMLAAEQITNYAKRDRFLFKPTIGVRYETTVDQLVWITDEIRKVLIAHPKVHQDYHRVRFSAFGAFSLDIEVFCWLLAPDYGAFTEVAEDINFAIARIVERSGTGFAFPSQTLYLGRDSAPPPERAAEVAREVAARRERGELAVPDPSPELLEKLRRET